MHRLLRRSLLAFLLLCLGSSCGPSPEADTQAPSNVQITNVTQGEIITGTRRLQGSAEDDSGRVARMEFRVSRTLVCADGTTRGSGAIFACNWNSSTAPEGNYQLIATAYDAAGNATSSEPVSITVPPPPPNQQPTLSAVKATPDVLDEGASTTLAVIASDPDGNTLTYSWTQSPPTPAGRFSDSTAASPTWTAPALTSDQAFTLQVTVSDGKGGTAQDSVDVSVTNLPENQAPTISAVTATPDTLDEGESTTLAVTANDPEGNTLTYSWTQSPPTPAGRFSDSTAANPTWTAPALTGDQTFTLQVTVSDGKGGTVQDSVEVPVTSVNTPPVVDAAITASATVVAGDSLKLSIGATDPDGDALKYAWTTTPVDAGTFLGGTTATSARWQSLDISANRVVTFQVTVSDDRSSVTRSVDVQVTVPTYAQVQQVWDATCTACHNAKSASGGLNLAADSSYDALVDSPGTSSACSAFKRVAPGLPNASLLVQKISGTTCGPRMPEKAPEYFDKNPGLLTRIRSWILAGAPSD
ncbi:PKD domain-containing protein [Archangium lipolyticum]|uniref:PKD domain-containing protein n=1 Tax=Archangium lipolyticum TaxID=2970465 RepID=UPI00214A0EE3|nr:PKD domain-containing protein [Archangium lipolyticum]